MGRNTRVQNKKPLLVPKKKIEKTKMRTRNIASKEIDIEEILESNIISTNDGSSKTRSGIKIGDRIDRTPKRPTAAVLKGSENKSDNVSANKSAVISPRTPVLTRSSRDKIMEEQLRTSARKRRLPVSSKAENNSPKRLLVTPPVSAAPNSSRLSLSKKINRPKHSPQEPVRSPTVSVEERIKSPDRTRTNLLNQLKSSLSPKMTEPSSSVGHPVSRYGRVQKQKENSDYIPLDVAKFITKSPPKIRPIKLEIEKLKAEDFTLEILQVPLTTVDSTDSLKTEPAITNDLLAAIAEVMPPLDENAEILGMDQIKIVDLDSSFGESNASTIAKVVDLDTSLGESDAQAKIDDVEACLNESISEILKESEVDVNAVGIDESVAAVVTVSSSDIVDTAGESVPSDAILKEGTSQEATIGDLGDTNLGVNNSGEAANQADVETKQANDNTNVTVTDVHKPESGVLEKSPDVDSAKGSSIDIDLATKQDLVIGGLFWGAFNAKSFHWPCQICPDPDNGTILKKIGKKSLVHVVYFADHGRRSWINEAMILPFNGLEKYKETVMHDYKHLKGKLKAALGGGAWLEAVKQAEDMTNYVIDKREERLKHLLELERSQPVRSRKRAKSLSTGYNSNSFDDSLESKQNIHRRSPTPESPAYEALPVSSNSNNNGSFAKRIKRDPEDTDLFRNTISRYFQSMADGSDVLETASGTSSESDDISEMTGFDREVYNELLNLSRMYVFEGQTETDIDRKLQKYVQKICALRMQPSTSKKLAGSARISNRLRSQALRNSFLKFEMELGFNQLKKEATEAPNPTTPKIKRPEKTLEEQYIFKLEKNYLMKGIPKGFICMICLKTNDVVKCSVCYNHYHPGCIEKLPEQLNDSTTTGAENKSLKCKSCSENTPQQCFVCNMQDESVKNEQLHRCASHGCAKYYHIPCLRLFPQHKLSSTLKSTTLFCPYHTCHTCVSDDPRANTTARKVQLVKCIKCPSAYHPDAKCVPAGSEILSSAAMICPKHSLEQCSINVNWCFLCCKGGSLICCETCPTAFHLECLKFIPPEGKYICEECESGRMPLYNEVVWAKYSAFRFWPALTVPPPDVPEPLQRKPHAPSDICVKFFSSHDYAWINRRRIYLYQEGDSDIVSDQRKSAGLSSKYNVALRQAKTVHELLQRQKAAEHATETTDNSFRPPMYVKIKSNRYVPPLKTPVAREEVDDTMCECKSSDPEPCGPESNCINRALLVECDAKVCPAKDRCQNQCFEKKQYPALMAKRFSHKGWGLVALEDIRQGQFVIEYVGEVINNEELARRLQQKQEQKDQNYYFLTIDSELTIDAGPKGNLARFINHSCEPNCETLLWKVGGAHAVGLFAIKDIPTGTELTFNYNFESTDDQKKVCHCGAPKCSGFIGKKYKPPVEEASSIKPDKIRKRKLSKAAAKRRRKSSYAVMISNRKSAADSALQTVAEEAQITESKSEVQLQEVTLAADADTVPTNIQAEKSPANNGGQSDAVVASNTKIKPLDDPVASSSKAPTS